MILDESRVNDMMKSIDIRCPFREMALQPNGGAISPRANVGLDRTRRMVLSRDLLFQRFFHDAVE